MTNYIPKVISKPREIRGVLIFHEIRDNWALFRKVSWEEHYTLIDRHGMSLQDKMTLGELLQITEEDHIRHKLIYSGDVVITSRYRKEFRDVGRCGSV